MGRDEDVAIDLFKCTRFMVVGKAQERMPIEEVGHPQSILLVLYCPLYYLSSGVVIRIYK